MPITLQPTTTLNQVRLNIGDTSGEYIADSVIEYMLFDADDNVVRASLKAFDYIIAELSKLCDETTDEVSVEWSQKIEHYRQLKRDYLSTGEGAAGVNFFIGGTSKTNNNSFYDNSDNVVSPVKTGDVLKETLTSDRSYCDPFSLG